MRADLVKILGVEPTTRSDQPGARRGFALRKWCTDTTGI